MTDTIIKALRAHSFTFANEADLQAGIEIALTSEGIAFEREVSLRHGDRIDFLVGAVGLEVKIKAGTNEVIRQLHRYAQCERVDSILLVTSSMRLATRIPHELNGKPVIAYCFAGDAL